MVPCSGFKHIYPIYPPDVVTPLENPFETHPKHEPQLCRPETRTIGNKLNGLQRGWFTVNRIWIEE